MHTYSSMHTRAGEREKERHLVNHTKELELFPSDHGRSWPDIGQIQEMIRFVCVKACSGCHVENGLETREGCAGISQVRTVARTAEEVCNSRVGLAVCLGGRMSRAW